MSYRDRDVASVLEEHGGRIAELEKKLSRRVAVGRFAAVLNRVLKISAVGASVAAFIGGSALAVSKINACTDRENRESLTLQNREDRALCESLGAVFTTRVRGTYDSSRYSVVCSREGRPLVVSAKDGRVTVTGR